MKETELPEIPLLNHAEPVTSGQKRDDNDSGLIKKQNGKST